MIVFEYVSRTWDAGAFKAQGGFVAVVLNYNKLSTIKQSSLSALNQSFDNYEALFMDDCSKDGSEWLMLNSVKEWCIEEEKKDVPKAIHIKVAFNDVNKTTLGQWKYATEISNGSWFGMFCGDDIAYENRMNVAHNIVRTIPNVIALCTNGDVAGGGRLCDDVGFHTWHIKMGDRPFYFMHGCSCFWHRLVLEKQDAKHTLDDFVLYWSAIILASSDTDLRIVWAYNEKTLAYSRSTGVTSMVSQDRIEKFKLIDTWRRGVNIRRFGKKFGINTWRIIEAFNKKYGSNDDIKEEIRGYCHLGEMESGGWLERTKTIYRVFVFERGFDYGGKRLWVSRMIRGLYISFIFGCFSYCFVEWCRFLRRRLYGANKECARYIVGIISLCIV